MGTRMIDGYLGYVSTPCSNKPIGFGLQIKTTARHFLVGSSSVVLYENDLENKVIVSYVARCSQKYWEHIRKRVQDVTLW